MASFPTVFLDDLGGQMIQCGDHPMPKSTVRAQNRKYRSIRIKDALADTLGNLLQRCLVRGRFTALSTKALVVAPGQYLAVVGAAGALLSILQAKLPGNTVSHSSQLSLGRKEVALPDD